MSKAALIVVDVQRDFCEGGALAAADTLSLLEPLQDCIEAARRAGAVIVFTQDWHPTNHSSFRTNGGPWPVHCEANSGGAQLMAPLRADEEDVTIHKGVSADGAGYSGFEATGLSEKLTSLGVTHLAVSGIATEYCVRATALDGLKAGFTAVVLTDMIRAVQPSETANVLAELAKRGVKAATAAEWLKSLRPN
ncbi:MAG TPA: isochorismatase family protein [Candidatus Limnocylindrales bacterium]|nr:isochorismatase family protein [Candidatus Limnocylindrales bacterium]